MTDLYTYNPTLQTRWASPENPAGAKGGACRGNDGRKRNACVEIAVGESLTLVDVEGAGMLRRFWSTFKPQNPRMLRGLRLDMYWDGAATPAVSAPFGDFFCLPLGLRAIFENALFSSPEGRSFNCYVPMPFRTRMRVVVTNEAGVDVEQFYYDLDYTLGDAPGDDALYLHTHWRRENPTTLREDYALLPHVAGRGRFLGVNVGIAADVDTYFKSWWGEGEVKIYLDGDTDHPTLAGTGTEDYIGTGWGQGRYASPYQGCHMADGEHQRFGFYRLHVPDPVYFHQDIRVTIQQLGNWGLEYISQMAAAGLELEHGDAPVDMAAAIAEHGYGLFERRDDWSSCAYFYLDAPANTLPALPAAAFRQADLEE